MVYISWNCVCMILLPHLLHCDIFSADEKINVARVLHIRHYSVKLFYGLACVCCCFVCPRNIQTVCNRFLSDTFAHVFCRAVETVERQCDTYISVGPLGNEDVPSHRHSKTAAALFAVLWCRFYVAGVVQKLLQFG